MPLPVFEDEHRYFHKLGNRYTEKVEAFMRYLEENGIEVSDSPPSPAWLMFNEALDAHSEWEIFWHKIAASRGARIQCANGIAVVQKREYDDGVP